MGYQTAYKLQILNPNESNKDAICEFKNGCDDADCAINAEGETEQRWKWYEHETDLKSFSKKYPDTIFKLSGEGEDSGDIWSLYCKNGKSRKENAELFNADYCEDKLK